MTEPITGSDDTAAAPGPSAPVLLGPSGTVAADSAFGVALVTLWHRVSLAGGAVGFLPTASRAEIAPAAAAAVDALKRGTAQGLAVTSGRQLIGFVRLTPGTGVVAHTAQITALMVDPDHQGKGIGRTLLEAAEKRATELGVERVGLSARGGHGLEDYYRSAGYEVWGVDRERIRVAPGDDRDETHLVKRLRG